jgi:hypothetical protein
LVGFPKLLFYEGIDYGKWNQGVKPTPQVVAAFSSTNNMEDFDRREAVFEKNRDEITAVFK